MFDFAMLWLRRLAIVAVIALGLLAAVALAIGANADDNRVDANVITALDVSSSINAQETMLQVEGMAAAVRSPAFVSAASAGPHRRIGFMIFVWADGDYPELVSWRAIGSQEEADAASAEILGKLQALLETSSRHVGTLTNLSGALDHASQLFKAAPLQAARQVVNIVGNGEDNVGEDPLRARADLVAMGATINGVVIGTDKLVMTYFRANVIGGKGAFLLSADKAEHLTTVLISKFVADLAMVMP
jgi:hypothetical protein